LDHQPLLVLTSTNTCSFSSTSSLTRLSTSLRLAIRPRSHSYKTTDGKVVFLTQAKSYHHRGPAFAQYSQLEFVLGITGQIDQVIMRTDDLKLPEIHQDCVKVDVSRQQGSSRDMRVNLSLLILYLAIQCHMLSIFKSLSSQHKELKVSKRENVAK
jgi:hypothetical protein